MKKQIQMSLLKPKKISLKTQTKKIKEEKQQQVSKETLDILGQYVYYFDFRNNEQKSQVSQVLNQFRKLLPFWVKELIIQNVISVSEDNDYLKEAILTIASQPEYRKITISIYPSYYARAEEQRYQDMLHEICHTFFGPITDWVVNKVFPLFEETEPNLHQFLLTEFTEKLESSTQDLCYVLRNNIIPESVSINRDVK